MASGKPGAVQTGAVVKVQGDLRGYKFYVGQRITTVRRESRFYVRDDQGVLPTDRLTVERFRLEMAETGYTRIEVTPDRGPKTQREFHGRALGSATGVSGTPRLADDALDATVGHLAESVTIDIINDSFLPSYWQTASYEYSAVGVAARR